jgi:pimeloyl-ACP methyl ester carboxylesterase
MLRSARVFAIACALCATRCSTVQSEPAARTWPAWLHECSIDGASGPARCGTVRVPESQESSAGRHIDLRVVVVPAYPLAPAPDAVLPLVGGPGQGAADLAGPLSRRYEALRDERDLVFIDQRGTGQSNGLHCAPPETAIDLMGKIFDAVRLAACRDELATRADLTLYTTAAAARDYGQILDELEYPQVNVVGTSYGTRLGLELARRFPLRIRTLTIEGVVPTSFDWPTFGASDSEAALTALADDCRADRACADAFPRFEQDIDVAFARLSRQRANVAVRDPATGAIERVPFGVTDLAYATRGLLYGNDALSLPLLFRQAAEGRFDAFAQAYVTRARTLDQQIARGVMLTVYCAEDVPFVDKPLAEKAASGTRLGDYLLTQYGRACEVWPRASIASSFRDPVQSAVPTLLLSGRRDPVTPPRTAEQVARTLPSARVLIWKYGGHGTDGLITGDCRTMILREFVATADVEHLSVNCMTETPVMAFRVSASSR